MEITHHHEHEHHHAHDHTRDWVKTALLVGLALYFGYNLISGNVTNYINTRFVWLSYVAVVLFGALAAANLYAILKHDHHSHEGHDHDEISWSMILIVSVPLVLGTLIPSKPLGAEAVGGNISLQAVSAGQGQAVNKDPLQRNVLDWLRLFTQTRIQSSFNGQPADVTGFVYREPNFPANHFMVARFTVACCVADASAIGLPVYIENADDITTGEWVRVQGAFEAGTFRDQELPILLASNVEIIAQPEHPYLYP